MLDSGNVYSDLTGWWLEWLEIPWLVVSASDDSDPEHGFPSFTSTGTATLCEYSTKYSCLGLKSQE